MGLVIEAKIINCGLAVGIGCWLLAIGRVGYDLIDADENKCYLIE